MSRQASLVLDARSRLPRGRHGIPQEVIAANQRLRLMSATAAVIAEQGYASLAVGDVIDRAGVSRATFYKLFKDKHDCVLASQRWAFDCLRDTIADAFAAGSGDEDWPSGVAAAVGAAVDFAARLPGEARLVLASSQSPSEPALAREDFAAHRELVQLLHEGSRRCPGVRSPSGLTEQAAVGAAMSIVGSYLAAEETDALPELKTDLIQIILIPYLGSAEAKRIAVAA